MTKTRRGARHARVMCMVVGATLAHGWAAAQAPTPSFATSGASLGASTVPTNGVGTQFELVFWQSVAATEDRAQIETYLQQFPNGTFSALARAKIGAIEKREAMARGATPAMPSAVSAAAPSPVAFASAPVPAAPPPAQAAPLISAAQGEVAPADLANTAPALTAMTTQLSALGRSQGMPPASPPSLAQTSVAALPSRPKLAPPSVFALPEHFCTAMDRNNFYDAVYRPAKDQADENNRNAIAYLDRLKAAYDAYNAGSDSKAMNQVARESQDFQAVAGEAYRTSVDYEGLFGRLMAVPVGKCP